MSGALHVLLAVSLAGVVLLPVFGAVLHFQPQLVRGLHVEPAAAERNCYLAAGCYGVTLLASGVALWLKKRKAAAATAAKANAANSEFTTLDKLGGLSPLPTRRTLTPHEKQLISATSYERQPSNGKKAKKKEKRQAEEAQALITSTTAATTSSTTSARQPDSQWDDECEPL